MRHRYGGGGRSYNKAYKYIRKLTYHCIHGSSCPEADDSSLYAMVAANLREFNERRMPCLVVVLVCGLVKNDLLVVMLMDLGISPFLLLDIK